VLQDKGLVVETTAPPEKKALLIKDHGRIVGMASRVRNAFVLDRPADSAFPAEDAADSDSDGQELRTKKSEYVRWHYRFGHIGPQIIRNLHTVVDDLQEVRPLS
jgi:hypothetical protein